MRDLEVRLYNRIVALNAPVQVKDLMEDFELSDSHISRALRSLYVAGKLTRKRIGPQVVWSLPKGKKRRPLALPVKAAELQPSEPPAPARPAYIWPWKTSYPHVRGYDD